MGGRIHIYKEEIAHSLSPFRIQCPVPLSWPIHPAYYGNDVVNQQTCKGISKRGKITCINIDLKISTSGFHKIAAVQVIYIWLVGLPL